jgi:hypothetical protein
VLNGVPGYQPAVFAAADGAVEEIRALLNAVR